MNTSFDRNRAQESCEAFLGCVDLTDWESKRRPFENLSLSNSQSIRLSNDLLYDAIDFQYKGLISLLEAIDSASKQFHSWSIVKSYYSTYYFLRSYLCINGFALIRNGSLFLLEVQINSVPQKKTGKQFNTTHEGTIYAYQELYKLTDPLLRNNIDDLTTYLWQKDVREIINYRERIFHEPEPNPFLAEVKKDFIADGILNSIIKYTNDPDYLYAFMPDYAVLGIPLNRAILNTNAFRSIQSIPSFELNQLNLLRTYSNQIGIGQFFNSSLIF